MVVLLRYTTLIHTHTNLTFYCSCSWLCWFSRWPRSAGTWAMRYFWSAQHGQIPGAIRFRAIIGDDSENQTGSSAYLVGGFNPSGKKTCSKPPTSYVMGSEVDKIQYNCSLKDGNTSTQPFCAKDNRKARFPLLGLGFGGAIRPLHVLITDAKNFSKDFTESVWNLVNLSIKYDLFAIDMAILCFVPPIWDTPFHIKLLVKNPFLSHHIEWSDKL